MWTILLLLAFSGAWKTTLGAPVPHHMVDMSYVFDNTTLNWPAVKKFEFKLMANGTTDANFWLQLEEYSSSTHVGTHMDAPCHFAKGGWSIDQVPLEHLIAPAAVVDITEKANLDSDYAAQVEDLQEWENTTGHTLNEVILLIRSGWGRKWSNRTDFIGTSGNNISDLHFPGISASASQWLVKNRKIYGIGTETLSIDPGPITKFESHRILAKKNIFNLENVANMENIPIYGATLYVMPMKIGRSSGAPCRIVAIFPEVIFQHKEGKPTVQPSLKEVIFFSK